ncbi:MAG: extracellular solute-binding protein [Candidatus Moraniibacteriota bacterium]
MMKIFSKRVGLIALIMMSGIFLSGCGTKNTAPQAYKVKLEVWGVVDDTDAYGELLTQYKKINPYVSDIVYRKFQAETYKEDVINALAAGNGPDIFMIRNAWRSAFEDKIVPMPNSGAAEKFYRDSFIDVVSSDFIKDGQIYAAPLSVDSLGLYYNKDLFNAAGITAPPTTWEEVLTDLNKLNRIDQLGNITQSAIALGTAYNMNRPADILMALMLQKGSSIENSMNGTMDINDEASRKAFEFYNQFSDIRLGTYSWNPRLHYSTDAFSEGTVGMILDYSWRYDELKKKNSKFNFGVAPLPQFTDGVPANFANYCGFVVAKNKTVINPQAPAGAVAVDVVKQNMLRIHEAWQFIRFMTFPHKGNVMTLQNGLTNMSKDFPLTIDPAKAYLDKTRKPAARRDLIDGQKTDMALAPFATGNLIAKNGYQGNPEGVTAIFTEMIDSVNKGERTVMSALGLIAQRVMVLGR